MFTPFRIIIVAAAMLAGSPGSACLNEYQQRKMPLSADKLDLHLLLHSDDKNESPYWRHGFDGEFTQSPASPAAIAKMDFRELSDYAVMRLKAGQKAEALKILEELYRLHPTEYNIVANLGTACDLDGNKARALELLKKAQSLAPHSHYGSEWIHIRILEEELAPRPDLKKIIGLNTGNFQEWLKDKSYRFPRPADSLKVQLAFQLHERIGFIAPPDKITGQLVTDFADIVAKTDSLGAAKEFYQFALRYDPALRDTIAIRMESIEASQKEVKDTFRWASIVWAIPLLALIMIFLAWLRSMRNQKRTEQ